MRLKVEPNPEYYLEECGVKVYRTSPLIFQSVKCDRCQMRIFFERVWEVIIPFKIAYDGVLQLDTKLEQHYCFTCAPYIGNAWSFYKEYENKLVATIAKTLETPKSSPAASPSDISSADPCDPRNGEGC